MAMRCTQMQKPEMERAREGHWGCAFPETLRNLERSQAPVAHDCNPSYSGGKDQEDNHLKAAWANN
jgi:hypothetical protein